MKIRLLMIAPLMMVSACTTNQMLESAPIIGNVCAAADRTLIDEKVVYAANALYNVPAQAYVTANRAGKIPPDLKLQIKPMLMELYGYVALIKAARGTANCDFTSMKALQARVLEILPRK